MDEGRIKSYTVSKLYLSIRFIVDFYFIDSVAVATELYHIMTVVRR